MKTAFERSRRPIVAALAIASAALLAACFGGGGDDAPVYAIDSASAPPDSASASSGGFGDFIVAMGSASLDGREPFELSSFNAPSDNADTLEPARTSIDQ